MNVGRASPAAVEVDHLSDAELMVLRRLRQLVNYGWGHLTISVRAGNILFAEYTETEVPDSA